MRRRRFLAVLGGAAASWPLTTRAQQSRIPVVGYLHAVSPEGQQPDLAAFRKALAARGFVEGRNVAVEYRYAHNDYDRLPGLVAELVRRQVAVILALGGAVVTQTAKNATANIPIVFVQGDDPVASGLVPSLSRPGGNVTGIAFLSTELGPKRLELLKELVPAATRYALLVNPLSPTTDLMIADMRAAAAAIGRKIEVFDARTVRDIDLAFAALVREGCDALVVGSSSLFATRGVQLATLAALNRLPTMYYTRASVEVGGLMSYGADIPDAVYQGSSYVGRILQGEKPADLPIVQSAKFEFVLNLQTARSFGLDVPPRCSPLPMGSLNNDAATFHPALPHRRGDRVRFLMRCTWPITAQLGRSGLGLRRRFVQVELT
jgi:putative ABC transport system substrate-binding protein